MKVILLRDVPELGRKDEIKKVADGYARNFLIPKRLAEAVTAAGEAALQRRRTRLDSEKKLREDLILKNLESIADSQIVIEAKVNEQGHLFAGVGRDEISEAIQRQTRLVVEPDMIELTKPVKEVGEYKIKARFGEKISEFILAVSAAS